jgi:hypothetical protein
VSRKLERLFALRSHRGLTSGLKSRRVGLRSGRVRTRRVPPGVDSWTQSSVPGNRLGRYLPTMLVTSMESPVSFPASVTFWPAYL